MTRFMAIVSVPAAAAVFGLAACAENEGNQSSNIGELSAGVEESANGSVTVSEDTDSPSNQTGNGQGAANRNDGNSGNGEGSGGDDAEMVVTGVLTREGVECPALRGDDGRLYTLAGSTGTHGPGDRLTVRGSRAEASICQQGTTINVSSIEGA